MDEARGSRAEAGRSRRGRAQGAKADQLQAALAALDPQLAEWADDFIFGQVWGRPGLAHEERMLVAITALAAGEHPAQLKNYLHGALQDGTPPEKIHEALLMLVVYCGFPTALTALSQWRSVVEAAARTREGAAAVSGS
jgi:alkylhydroperoxidase/carboxymuconolactone decarboxylase family protein YurZ